MLPVSIACAQSSILVDPATSYALEPFATTAGITSSLNRLIQITDAAVMSLSMMLLLVTSHLIFVSVTLVSSIFACTAIYVIRHRYILTKSTIDR